MGLRPSAAELFDPTTGEFTAVGNITVSRFFHETLERRQSALGGGESSGATATAELTIL